MKNREGIGTFTVLEIADGGSGKRQRRRRPELTRVPVRGGSFFYVLRVPRHSDLSVSLRLAARCAPVVVTTLPVQPDACVRLFVPRAFSLRRASAALCAILPRTRLPPQKLTVGALDPDDALCGGTQTLLPLASDVRIVTQKPDLFRADASAARRRFGASLTVDTDASLLTRCDAVVCAAPVEAIRNVPVVLSCEPADGVFSLLPVTLPEDLARLRPDSVPPDLFAAALAQRCGVRDAAFCACTGVSFDGRELDAEQAAALWRARILCVKKGTTAEKGDGQGKTGRDRDTQETPTEKNFP